MVGSIPGSGLPCVLHHTLTDDTYDAIDMYDVCFASSRYPMKKMRCKVVMVGMVSVLSLLFLSSRW